ncbi:carboxypeptidase S [[Candida] railenensis]|uniref:Carboxypeptidase S n=1 Tax=[Candida] railenensis TaxID=45579 RepID=A0A9P0QSH7_9ASCO|nr:carboxypeptidase S [[Candida] railenensis]
MSDIEKQDHPDRSVEQLSSARKSKFTWKPVAAICTALLVLYSSGGVIPSCTSNVEELWPSLNVDADDVCPLIPYVRPETYLKDNSTLDRIIYDASYRNQSAAKLSGAVQVKTDTYDDSPLVGDDPKYWEAKFKPFHQYLAKTFPTVFKITKLEKVNNWGLVFTWEGSDASLKPILLTAHQDVVPTQDATLKDWTYPPYDGVYDGEHLWGRGSADCKNLLIGVLEALEELHQDGFKPKRTIVLGFGFDEEIGGENGAQHIGKHLIEKYGKSSFYAVIDEGGQSLIEQDDIYLALPGTGEKGMVNLVIGLNTPGGHSSVPPAHTSIGIISKLISAIEDKQFDPIFSPRNPTFQEFQCVAVHSPSLSTPIKHAILNSEHNKIANGIAIEYLSRKSLDVKALISTTQAIDIIHGGAKSNALPEYVEAVINHRISVESSVNATVQKDLNQVFEYAEKFDLGVVYEGEVLKNKTAKGYFTVYKESTLEPAPLTPTNDRHWEVLGGSIRHVYEEVAMPEKFAEKPVVVAPGIATGNTDTQWYWSLTEHIFRYRPGLTPTLETHAHGVDEHIPFDSHLQIIAFYYEYLQVIDEESD